jgi:hypothetical protein
VWSRAQADAKVHALAGAVRAVRVRPRRRGARTLSSRRTRFHKRENKYPASFYCFWLILAHLTTEKCPYKLITFNTLFYIIDSRHTP